MVMIKTWFKVLYILFSNHGLFILTPLTTGLSCDSAATSGSTTSSSPAPTGGDSSCLPTLCFLSRCGRFAAATADLCLKASSSSNFSLIRLYNYMYVWCVMNFMAITEASQSVVVDKNSWLRLDSLKGVKDTTSYLFRHFEVNVAFLYKQVL